MERWFPRLPHRLSRTLDYAVAVIAPTLAAGLAWAVQAENTAKVPLYPIFTLSIIVSSLVGGLPPGLVASGLSLAYIYKLFLPAYTLELGRGTAFVSYASFTVVCLAVVILVSVLRKEHLVLRQKEEELRSQHTSLTLSEERYRESEARLRAVIENLAEGIVVVNPDSTALDWNQTALRMHGYEKPEEETAFFSSIRDHFELRRLDGTPLPVEQWPLPRLMRGEDITDFEVVVRKKADGWERIFRYGGTLIPSSSGQAAIGLLTIRDVTELRQAQEVLRRSEARLHALVNATSDVIYSMSPDWSEMRQLRSQHFLTPTEIPSRTWLHKYIPPEEQETVMAVINEAVRKRSTFMLEHRVWRLDGTVGWTFSRAIPLLNDKGEVLEWFGVASETTERRQAQEALLRSEKLAATGRLAATIAHEVNNPLAAAMNAIYLACIDPALKPETKNILTMADQELRRAAHITQQTLGFYRESSGKQQVALPRMVEELLSVYATKLRNRKVSIQCRYRCNLTPSKDTCPENCEQCNACLVVHAGELRQIISNLLANGIDALSDGGVMFIRVSRLSDRVQLTIADNGQGIRTEHLKRIFEPFFTTKESVGTGLGLWVTQELVRKHNGVIKVRSRRDKGTVFRLTFPQRPADGSFGDIEIAPHTALGTPA